MGKRGKSIAALASHLNTTRTTLYHWATVYPEWDAALKQMKEHAEAYWEAIGETYAHIPKDGGTFNIGVWKHFMAVRFGQHEKQVIDTNSTNEINVVIAPPKNEDVDE